MHMMSRSRLKLFQSFAAVNLKKVIHGVYKIRIREKVFPIIHYLYVHIVSLFFLIAGLWWDGYLICMVNFGWFTLKVKCGEKKILN